MGGSVFLAVFVWGFALHGDTKWWLIGAAITGAVTGGLNGLVVASQATRSGASDMKTASGMLIGGFSFVTGFAGGVVWLLRSVF